MFEQQPDIGISGIKININSQAMSITSDYQMKVLSSAPVNGGSTSAKSIINCHVKKNSKNLKPVAFLQRIISKLALPSPTVGLITTVKMKNLSIKRAQDGKVVAIITAGSSLPVAAGNTIEFGNPPQVAINTILIIDGSLTEGAMVEVVKTATEAKTITLGELDIRSSFSGGVASGTVTDSICVACTERGKPCYCAGTGTRIGQAIAWTVRKGMEEAIMTESGLSRNRSAIRRLGERGIQIDDLVETGMALFVGSATTTKERTAILLRRGLIDAVSDINVASFIIAAMRLDEDGKTGSLPALTAEAFAADPINLVADETLGIAIANYIAGTRGFHNFMYYDRMKPGITKKLSPFLDDAICGLVAGVMSKVLREDSSSGKV